MAKKSILASDKIENLLWSQRFSVIASQFLLAVMITCFVVPVVQIFQRITPTWQFDYLVPLSFLIAIESILSGRRLSNVSFVDVNWWLYHLAEWVIILLLVKSGLYASRGWQEVLFDFPLWQADFFANFFTLEYLTGVGIIVLVWLISRELAGLLGELETDEILVKLQLDSEYIEQRSAVRQRLAAHIIAYGALAVALTTLVRLDAGRVWNVTQAAQAGFTAVILYFVCGLALLSLTQFSVLRVRWMLDHVRIDTALAVRWFLTVLSMLLILALIAVVLPTGYSQDFLGLVQFGLAFLINLIITLVLIILTPFLLLYGWLMSLFTSGEPSQIEIQPLELPQLPQRPASVPIPWVEQLMDILVWVLIVGMVGFSLVYYFREHAELFKSFQGNKIYLAISVLWSRLVSWLRRINREAIDVVSGNFQKLHRRSAAPGPLAAGWLGNPRRLHPRHQVLYYYLAMVRRAGEKIIPRQASQTPYEYAETLKALLESAQPPEKTFVGEDETLAIGELTDQFIQARYSRHEITSQQATKARLNWAHIRRLLRIKLS